MRYLFITVLTGLLYSSCLTTLHPFISNDPSQCLALKKELLGRWEMDSLTVRIESFLTSPLRTDETKEKDALLRQPAKSREQLLDSLYFTKQYLVSYSKDNIRYVYQCGLTRIDGQIFMEIQPQQYQTKDYDVHPDYYNFQRTYTLARVNLDNNFIQLEFLDGDFIKNQIMSGNMRIRHEHEKMFDSFVITAVTSDLRAFISKYGRDDRLYKNGNKINLTRKNFSL